MSEVDKTHHLERLAQQSLAVLIIDLEYGRRPLHGHEPTRHQLLWHLAVEAIGEDATRAMIVRLCDQMREGKNAAIKTSPLKMMDHCEERLEPQ